MFAKLRNRLIAINVGITTVLLIVIFTSIYLISAHSAGERPMNQGAPDADPTISQMMDERLKNDRQASLHSLLVTLMVTGIVMDVLVAIISYFLAEEAIKPVKQAYDTQKVFIANASHEIKTPLAALQANLEAADIKDNHWIDNVAYEADRLAALNHQLLTLARTDAMPETITLKTVNLHHELDQMVEMVRPQLPQKVKLAVRHTGDRSTKTKINFTDFSQLVNILLDNARKYCKTKITVTLNDHNLKITNDGTTIKAADLPHIFDRFYQSDKSSAGVGLGLAIAATLAERNQWELAATSNKNTTFTLIF